MELEECTLSSWQFKSVLIPARVTFLVKGVQNGELVLSTLPPPRERRRQKEELVCGTAGVVTHRLKNRLHRLHAEMQEGFCFKVKSEVQPKTQGILKVGELQTGIQESGELQTGIQESGELQTGIHESGELQTGIQESGET